MAAFLQKLNLKPIKLVSLVMVMLLGMMMRGEGQVSVTNVAPNVTIDFSSTISGVSNGAYTAAGFQSSPTEGQLNSNAWAITGWSDGDLAFAGTRTTASDYTRGTSSVAVGTGGLYSYTGTPGSVSNPTFMIQPGGSDFAPGTITLRIKNDGTTNLTQLALSYNLYVRNDQARSSSFNFSYSSDNITYTSVGSLDYTSPAVVDALGWVLVGVSPSKSTTITGLTIAPSSFFYIRWSSADVGGSGSRDEFGLDDISLTGTFAVAVPAPEINLRQSTTNIASGGSFDFGSIVSGNSSATTTFTIENTGNANLNLTSTPKIAKSGTNAAEFTVDQSATVSPVTGSSSTTFTITFLPTSVGSKTATITIANNDADEGTYTFTITGTATAAAAPEINLKQGATSIATSGSFGFGSVASGSSSTATIFTIENLGTANLNLTGTPKIAKSGTNAAEFTIDQTLTTSPVSASGNTTFTITFSPTTTGSKTATITIANNDTDEGSYTFTITGTATAAAPANDNCVNAISLTVNSGSTCSVSTTGTTVDATLSQSATIGTADDDVWYSFVATSTSHVVTVTPSITGGITDVVFQSFSGACGSLTSLGYVDLTSGTSTETVTLTGLISGNAYYVRVYSYGSTVPVQGTFTICITIPPPDYISLSSVGTAVTENFDGMATGFVIPTGFGIQDGNTTSVATVLTQAASSGSPTAGGSYNWGQSSSERAIGLMYSGSYDTKSVIVKVRNNTGATASNFIIGFNYEQYRRNISSQTFKLQYSTSLTTGWVDVAGGAFSSLLMGTSTYSYSPLIASQNISITYVPTSSVASGNDVYFRWILDGSSNSTGVGIDNFSIAVPNSQSIADYRTKAAGNFTTLTNWEYNTYGSNYAAATQVPTSTNNVTILHKITLDQDFTVGSGKTLTLASSLTTADTFNVAATRTLIVTGSAVFNDKPVTFKSSTAGTAALGQSATITGATNVTVERYIPQNSFRAWRLLSIPTVTTQSIKAAWQNGQTAGSTDATGKGTWITSFSATAVADGYDAKTTGNSMLAYNATNNAWVGKITPTTDANSLATDNGYLLYIRGDRQATSGNSTITPTTLSTNGTLKQGDQSIFSIPVNALPTGNYVLIGNPYASQIDLRNLPKSNTAYVFYVWDPKKGTSTGGFQTLTYNGSNYIATPGGGSYTAATANTIESGQAFFVGALATTGTIQFKEIAKSTGSSNIGFIQSAVVIKPKTLITNLYAGQDAGAVLVDGTMQYFDASYSGAVDDLDARKMTNFTENFGITAGTQLLAVEKRNIAATKDTIFYSMTGMVQKGYHFEFIASKLNSPGLKGFLEDSYLGTRTPISLKDTTIVNFTVDANTGSSAANRFRIVFKTKTAAFADAGSDIIAGNGANGKGIAVYPNPVTNGNINVSFNNQPAGKYVVMLTTLQGQQVLSQLINHAGGNTVQSITLGRNITAGSYQLSIIYPDKTRAEQTIIITR